MPLNTIPNLVIVILLLVTATGHVSAGALQPDPGFYKYGQRIELDQFTTEIRNFRVVLVGETHDRFDHHIQQLQIIREIHKRYPNIAIGLEYFQKPFQAKLDAFVNGTIDTREMLRGAEYYRRWRFDYRLYEPILSFARENKIPLVALNVPAEITRKVGAKGIAGLDPAERAQLPADVDRTDEAYRDRLKTVFEQHYKERGHGSFENFYDAQLLWDEGMAATAAEYLARFPRRKMVILAGAGHIAYGHGIPRRLQKRLQENVATVVPADGELDLKAADYVFVSQQIELPRSGLLGVFLDPEPGNQVRSVQDDGGASAAGVRPGDVITAIDDEPVSDLTDIKASLWHKRPGDTVALQISRAEEQKITLMVVLR